MSLVEAPRVELTAPSVANTFSFPGIGARFGLVGGALSVCPVLPSSGMLSRQSLPGATGVLLNRALRMSRRESSSDGCEVRLPPVLTSLDLVMTTINVCFRCEWDPHYICGIRFCTSAFSFATMAEVPPGLPMGDLYVSVCTVLYMGFMPILSRLAYACW